MTEVVLESKAEKTVTLESLMALGPDARVEVIDGEVLLMSPVGGIHHVVVTNLFRLLDPHCGDGLLFPDGLLYLMGSPPGALRDSLVPDLSFIRAERVRPDWDLTRPYPGAPDLAVEVISPNESAEAVQRKVRLYLDKGVEEVWVVYPEARELHQYQREREPRMVRVYRNGETLEAPRLFPGMELPLAAIFALPAALKR
jgi:Uma2 family endonuclease